MNINKFIPSRDTVLVRLPSYTEKLLRKDEVLTINTLNQILYAPTKGEVVSISPTLKNHQLEINDTVYFEKLHWEAAKEAAFDSTSERDKGIYFQQEVYAIYRDDTFYMVLPFKFLYMAQGMRRKLQLTTTYDYEMPTPYERQSFMLNNYVLCEPVAKKEDDSILKIADLREDDYALNQVKVANVYDPYSEKVPEGRFEVYAKGTDYFATTNNPDILWQKVDKAMKGGSSGSRIKIETLENLSFLKNGDTVFTERHSDIPLEEEINQTNPNKQFIIESDCIICKLENMQTYKAAPNRIVIELIPQPEDNEQILKIDSEFANCQMAKVISAGTGVECKEGETIVLPRNAGRKNKLPILAGMTAQYEVIGRDDYFCIVAEEHPLVQIGKTIKTALDTLEKNKVK